MSREEAAKIVDLSKLPEDASETLRIVRIGSLRAFFTFHIQIIDDCVFFKYLVTRSEAYDKKYEEKLRKDDK